MPRASPLTIVTPRAASSGGQRLGHLHAVRASPRAAPTIAMAKRVGRVEAAAHVRARGRRDSGEQRGIARVVRREMA